MIKNIYHNKIAIVIALTFLFYYIIKILEYYYFYILMNLIF